MDTSAPARIKEFLKEKGRDKFHIIFVFRLDREMGREIDEEIER